MSNPISDWFQSGKDYYSGVLLLRRFQKDTTRYDPYLNRTPPNFLSFQLQTALENCVILLPTLEKPRIQPIVETPALVLQWKNEAKKWHKLESDNHSRLHFATTKEARAPIVVERMTVIAPALDELYRKIKLYEKSGQLEVPKMVESEKAIEIINVQSINQLWIEKSNLESRLSRIKKQAKYVSEATTKFERLFHIHQALQLPFEKQLSDYLP